MPLPFSITLIRSLSLPTVREVALIPSMGGHIMRVLSRALVAGSLVAIWLPALAGRAGAVQTTFSNTTSISMATSGAAVPYPSNISVSGIGGQVGDVRVTLINVSHTFEEDVNVLLVGPGGQKVMLVSDVGGGETS